MVFLCVRKLVVACRCKSGPGSCQEAPTWADDIFGTRSGSARAACLRSLALRWCYQDASDLPAITATVSQIAYSAGLCGRYCPAAGPVPGGASPVADGSGCGPDSARVSGPASESAWPAGLGSSAVTATGL